MKVLVTGAAGQLGRAMMEELKKRGHEAVGTVRAPADIPSCIQLDITDPQSAMAAVTENRPEAVVHCAAWTAVDLAEENAEQVWAVNVEGTENIALACRAAGSRMVYISTDYVFDGRGTEPWPADCKSYRPLSVYGRSKLAGEQAVSKILDQYFIVRTAWVFGPGGKNFVDTILGAGEKNGFVRVVCDQIGTPTYTRDLARLLADMIQTERYGYYHATSGGGYISWYEFTREIYRQAGCGAKVIPVTTEQYGPSKAARPFNSRLDNSKLEKTGFTPLPPWQDALGRYLEERKNVNSRTD
ncbi:MAG TPA: dTDP-4-dehydrorhamnose reductase [Lachnospiraceae bacterium]|nr:dTDP-4-dehydrorhamnose reductase [Lachnospiraceae bacterium]